MSLFVGNKIIGWWGIKSIIKSQVAQENVHVTLPQFFFSPPKRNERNLKIYILDCTSYSQRSVDSTVFKIQSI